MKRFKLIAKLLLFTVCLIWILGFVFTGLVLEPVLHDAVVDFGITEGVTNWFIWVWYWLTIIVMSIFASLRSFKLIGRWEKTSGSEKVRKD